MDKRRTKSVLIWIAGLELLGLPNWPMHVRLYNYSPHQATNRIFPASNSSPLHLDAPISDRQAEALRTHNRSPYSTSRSSSPPATPARRQGGKQDGLAGAEERGDADAGAAGGVSGGGVPGRVRDGRLPAHAARVRRWGGPHGARHRPQLALLQPAPAQVARRRRG